MVLDPRMFRREAFISNNTVLLQVLSVTVIGKFPRRKRTVLAEDCKTEAPRKLTEKELTKFHWVA